MGDAREAGLAQAKDSLNGKILRLEANGSVPADNPFPGSPVWSLGHRNPQGLAWDGKRRLLAAEHGPSAHDEINRIEPGKNYGWARAAGADRPAAPPRRGVDPTVQSQRGTWAPSGIASLCGSVWGGALRGERL